ncbi:MAG: hypothetical protein JSV91_12870 [Phycisphaerales bacterium]|nr:MAG: hypothetical protein JSV91_12870 [Phycisphaerales bacterium]
MTRQPCEGRVERHGTQCRAEPGRLVQRGRGLRRGVSSVLAMMFMVIFGSLAAAMAVVAQGNLRTADSGLKMSRAMSAAETGLIFAGRRLAAEARRFVVEKGVIDDAFAQDLWMGTYDEGTDGTVEVLPPQGYDVETPPTGVVEAVRDAHLADTHWLIIDAGDESLPEIDPTYGTLRVRPIGLTNEENGPYFRLLYELVSGEPAIRVTSVGVDGAIQRSLQMDFRLDKKIEFAILSPNRVMIGKNVRVEGPLGSRYGLVEGELDPENGDPLVMRSDFYWLDEPLDALLDTFFTAILSYDVDGDGRLRPDHPVEGEAVDTYPQLVDYDGDEYIDDCDLFMDHYDTNADYMVVYDTALASAAGLGSLAEEFDDIDDQLARLIDEANPDRDGDGEITAADTGLGYRDGVIDTNDLYAKVRGRLAFAVARAAWESYHGASYQTVVNGPIRADIDEAPVTFEVTDEDMREITTDMFSDTQTWFEGQVPNDPDDFESQRDASGTFTPYVPGDRRESIPYGSSAAYDYYARDRYEGITFRNVRIPMGCNGLFVDCTFIGVTFVETEPDCLHENWNYADAREEVEDPPGSGNWTYQVRFPELVATLSDNTPVPDTRVMSNNIRFHNCTFLGSISGVKPGEYTHWRNKVQITGVNTRSYCDPDDPDLDGEPDADALRVLLNSINPEDLEELQKSSILMPGWSFDVGNFSNEDADATSKLKLKGTIIAGILDVRGTADVHGTLLMTFRPQEGVGPLFYGGLPDAFNTTIGYFEPEAGGLEGKPLEEIQAQGFGEISLRYNPEAKLPDGIPWPICAVPDPDTYRE